MTRLARRATALLLPIALLMGASAVSAFQPAVVGVQPLRARVVEIDAEVKVLNERMAAADTTAEARADAYRRYQTLVAEREQLSQRIAEATDPARENPLINYASPVRTTPAASPSSIR